MMMNGERRKHCLDTTAVQIKAIITNALMSGKSS